MSEVDDVLVDAFHKRLVLLLKQAPDMTPERYIVEIKEIIALVKASQPDHSELIDNILKILHSQSYFTFENNSTPPSVQVVEWSNVVKLLKALKGD